MRWEEIPLVTDDWAVKVAAPAYDIRCAVAGVYTAVPIGVYYHPGLEKAALFPQGTDAADQARVLAATERAVGPSGVRPLFLTYQEVGAPETQWVKVAYSPTLRRLGEATNFFPGQYPGGLPNHPSPVAAMLTSGLVGAGLGWGGGKLLNKLLPERFGDNLGRTGLILGGLLGAAPGAAWGGVNTLTGNRFNDSSLTQGDPLQADLLFPRAMDGSNAVPPAQGAAPLEGIKDFVTTQRSVNPKKLLKFSEDLEAVPLGKRYQAAVDLVKEAFGDSFGAEPDDLGPTPLDVNVNSLGQTLWQAGATPRLAASTMGAMFAAQQFPDARAQPGLVTAHQMGQLAQSMGQPYQEGPKTNYGLNAAKDFIKGTAFGLGANALVGTPYRAGTFGLANAGLGVIGAVVSNFFGG